ncbi:putative lipoprotein [Burkholderia aenigmatica]|uniref:Lipoprotein n=1 Tax=Burkholderia aenigmatica TaxID=2015348 RepID=A0ABY6XV47_9BURK|nr:putative lipoprotein [Burkholderia aenigmatica]VWD02853.1 putative lipoprotein [Burkholderia aenigmatica]
MTPRPYEIAACFIQALPLRDLSPSLLKDAMHNRFRLFSVSCALAAATVLAACSTPPKPIYQQEQFDATSSPYAHTFHSKSDAACEAARRALLSQGYVVSSSRNDAVDGSKNFQPNNDMHVVIEFHVVCADANADGSSSIAYVNAVQDRYTLKKSNTSASVGLSVFGSLSLPIGSSDDALVKTASETIPAGVFYERFFNLVEHFLKIDPARRDRATVKAAEKEPVTPLPEPAPTPQGEPMKMTTPVVPTPPAAPVPLSLPVVAPESGANAVPAAASAVVAPAAMRAAAPVAASGSGSVPASGAASAPAASSTPSPAIAPAPASGSASTPASAHVPVSAPASASGPASPPAAAAASTPAVSAPAATTPAGSAPASATSAPV